MEFSAKGTRAQKPDCHETLLIGKLDQASGAVLKTISTYKSLFDVRSYTISEWSGQG